MPCFETNWPMVRVGRLPLTLLSPVISLSPAIDSKGGILKTLKPLIGVLLTFIVSATAHATFVPQDKIRYDLLKIGPSNMTKDMFNAIVTKMQRIYGPIVAKHGATLEFDANWNDGTLNASANQFFGTWQINLYGGLARLPDLTADGFALVVCHEMGHHLGGFSFIKESFGYGDIWAANEGQADYFSTQICAKKIWADEVEENAKYRAQVSEFVKNACDASWQTEAEQNLCYRIDAAAFSIAKTLASLTDTPEPSFETPDPNVVRQTSDEHPEAQCRLDTTFAASLCTVPFEENVIPGKELDDKLSTNAEKEAAVRSCTAYSNQTVGLRPACWFKARL